MPLAGLSFAGTGEDNASFLLVVVEKKKKMWYPSGVHGKARIVGYILQSAAPTGLRGSGGVPGRLEGARFVPNISNNLTFILSLSRLKVKRMLNNGR